MAIEIMELADWWHAQAGRRQLNFPFETVVPDINFFLLVFVPVNRARNKIGLRTPPHR